MGSEGKDPFRDWKSVQEPLSSDSGDGVKAKKRVRRRIREVPEYYFWPRRSLTFNLLFYGAAIAGGIGAGMLVEAWMKKKIEEDGGVIWEFDKK